MKRFFLSFLCTLLAASFSARSTAQHFSSSQYLSGLQKWQRVEQTFKSRGWPQWSMAVKEAFPVDDNGAIRQQFIIESDSPCDMEKIETVVKKWLDMDAPTRTEIPTRDLDRYNTETIWSNVARSFRFFSGAYLSAKVDMHMEFKPNRLRFTIVVPQYTMETYRLFKAKSNRQRVGSCYPINPQADWRDVSAMAFVNTNKKILATAGSLIEYLNRLLDTTEIDHTPR